MTPDDDSLLLTASFVSASAKCRAPAEFPTVLFMAFWVPMLLVIAVAPFPSPLPVASL